MKMTVLGACSLLLPGAALAQMSPLDGRFLLNEEALRNFGGDQLKKTHDVAMTLIAAFYNDADPEYVCFQGNPQGGHS